MNEGFKTMRELMTALGCGTKVVHSAWGGNQSEYIHIYGDEVVTETGEFYELELDDYSRFSIYGGQPSAPPIKLYAFKTLAGEYKFMDRDDMRSLNGETVKRVPELDREIEI